MSFLVCFQVSRLCESFIAHQTMIRLLARMSSHMDCQDIISSKLFTTNFAFVRSLITMLAHIMILQMTFGRKSFLACDAFKWFDAVMTIDMIL